MSDQLKGLVVTLDDDYTEEAAELIASAIRMVRGVVAVDFSIGSIDDHMNRVRVRRELLEKMRGVLEQESK